MTYTDAQIEIALLASIERQAKRTAAALARVYNLMRRVRDAQQDGRAAARPPERKCVVCGSQMKASSPPHTLYCSHKCAARAFSRRKHNLPISDEDCRAHTVHKRRKAQ